MKKRTLIYVIIAIGVVGAALVAILGAGYLKLRRGAVVKETAVYVPTGATYRQLLDSLGGEGEKIKDLQSLHRAAAVTGLDKKVVPGFYKLSPGMSYITVARTFGRGWQSPVRVTFNNIRSMERMAGAVARYLESDSLQFLAHFDNDSVIHACGFTRETFMAMFLPNTYEFYWTATPDSFIERMHREYNFFWNSTRREKLARTGLTPLQASILASIVYEETKMSDEMPVVAGVYINRLKIGMPLQADPTVKFAVSDPTIRRVLHRHLEVDSPYNTYKYAGLPPGPICMPSVTAIDAVLNYKEHKYIYFCARPDYSGYHSFAVTLAEHNRNAQQYSAFLNRERIMR